MALVRYDLLHAKALRAALVEHMGPEYPVPKERQVRRWISGDSPWPGWARKATDDILGTTKEAPRPVWAEGLDTKVELILWALRLTPEEQADLLAKRARGESWPPREADASQSVEAER